MKRVEKEQQSTEMTAGEQFNFNKCVWTLTTNKIKRRLYREGYETVVIMNVSFKNVGAGTKDTFKPEQILHG